MSDLLSEIRAETWAAASVEAYKRAGEHVCRGEYDKARDWQSKAVDFARRGYIKDSK